MRESEMTANAGWRERSAKRKANLSISKINIVSNSDCTALDSPMSKGTNERFRRTFRGTRHLQHQPSPTNVDAATQESFSDLALESNTCHDVLWDQDKLCTLLQTVDRKLDEKKSASSTGGIGEHHTRRVRFSSFVTIKILEDESHEEPRPESREALRLDENRTYLCLTPSEPSPSIIARLTGVLSRSFPCVVQKLPSNH